MPLGFETNNGPIRFDHERVELIKGIDTPNRKAHFEVARETPINADMRVSRQWQSVVLSVALGQRSRAIWLIWNDC